MKKTLALILVLALVVSMFTACGPSGNDDVQSGDSPVVVYIADIFNTLDPFATTANSDQAVFDQVYETLAITQDDGTVKPCLAAGKSAMITLNILSS